MVVFEQDRASALSAPARAQGVQEGMRRGGAQLLAPDASCHERDLPRETALLEQTALALLQYTPQVSLAEQACVLLDVGASLRLFGGIRALCRQIRRTIARLGVSPTLSCAATASGAGLLARSGDLRSLSMASTQRRLDRLPLHLLSAARPYLAWLHGLGCRRLGDVRRLPRAGLRKRCGQTRPNLLDMLDHAYGQAPELHRWITAPPVFHARLELPDRIDSAELLALHAQRLLAQLAGWLAAHQLGARQLRLVLEHERGRQAVAPSELTLALAAPAWEEAHLHALLKERLAQGELAAPAIALVLLAEQVAPRQAASESLFPEPGGAPEDHQRLIELLVARLGAGQVQHAVPRDDHRPEVGNRWHGVLQDARGLASPVTPDAMPSPRPLWLLATPQPLPLRQGQPCYQRPLILTSPPERIETGWWEGTPVIRDYFTARDARHVYYWIYRTRSGDDRRPQWFLHGLFG